MLTINEDTILRGYMGLSSSVKKVRASVAVGTKTGTTAEIYGMTQAIRNSDPVSTLQVVTPTPSDLNPANNYVALGWDDWFPIDQINVFPIANKYGCTNSFAKQLSPLSDDSRNEVLRYNPDLTKMIELMGSKLGNHNFQHTSFISSCPLCDGRITPSANDLRLNRGDGLNELGNDVNDTVDTSIGLSLRSSFMALSAILGAKAWKDLTDADCLAFRKALGVFGMPSSAVELEYTLQSLDYLSNRYCGTTGRSVFDDYTTRTPNTADGDEPSGENLILGGIFQGAATTQNHEIWERVLTIMAGYNSEFYGKTTPMYYYSTPGGTTPALLYNSDEYIPGAIHTSYTDKSHTKIACGATRYTSSIIGQSRSYIEVIQASGYITTKCFQGDGYAHNGYDGLTRLEAQRIYKKNGLKKPDNVGDGGIDKLGITDGSIPAEDITTLLASEDLVKSLYDYVHDTVRYDLLVSSSFYYILNFITKYNAWGLIPDIHDDSAYATANKPSLTLVLEAFYQFCLRAGITVISHEEACILGKTKPMPTGFNYFPNHAFATTVKTITASTYAPTDPDGWNGGVVLSEDTGSGSVNVIHKDTDGAIFIRQYAIKPSTLNLSFKAKGIGTLLVKKIMNKHIHPYLESRLDEQYVEINSIAINSPDSYTEYTATVSLPDAPLEIYSAPATPVEEVYQNYMKGYGDKICGIQIELIIAGGNYVKLGNPSLIE